MADTQGYSRLHSRQKGVQQAPCEIHSDTAGSTLGTKGYSRLNVSHTGIQSTLGIRGYNRFHARTLGYSRFHSRHKGVQQVSLQVHKGTVGSALAQRGAAGSMPDTQGYTDGSTLGTKVY